MIKMFSNQTQFPNQPLNQSTFQTGANPMSQGMSHNHSSQAVNVTMELQEIEKALNEAQTLKVQAETNLKHYHQQFQEVNMELQQLGVNPENAKMELERLSEEIVRMINEIKTSMPQTLVDDLKTELNKPLEVEIELPNMNIAF